MEFANKVLRIAIMGVAIWVGIVCSPLFWLFPDAAQAQPAAVVLAQALSSEAFGTKDILFPGETGRQLIEHLAARFAPKQLLSYDAARALMYGSIDNHDSVLEGLYTGYQIQVNPQADSTQEATRRGINAEHLWPQSKGARAVKSDLHNLYPVRMQVNSTRSNYPFADIPDRQTMEWFRKSRERKTKPRRQTIEQYSEFASGQFEPRDAKKGDIARVLFYFRTLYGDIADVGFFEQQRETLCCWSAADPIDASERQRSHAVAASPQGNENPFVLDSTLPERTYCSNWSV